MAKLREPQQLFALKLSKLRTAEREILEILQTQQKEANDPELKEGFKRHAQETRQQIKNVEQALKALGQKPQETKERIVEGVRGEHNEFMRNGAEPQLIDAFLAGSATHVEHHEISSYEDLILMADAMGEEDIVALLQENLDQEQNMLREVQRASQRLVQQVATPTAVA